MIENSKKCKICKKPVKELNDNDICLVCFNKPPPKYYFDVKIECMLPATLTYRVFAEDAEQAAEMIKGLSPNSVHHKLIGRKETKLTVYDAGCSMIRFIKKLVGG